MKNIQVGTWVEIGDEYCEVYKVTETDNTISVCNETQAFDVTLDEVKQIFDECPFTPTKTYILSPEESAETEKNRQRWVDNARRKIAESKKVRKKWEEENDYDPTWIDNLYKKYKESK